MLVKFLKIVTTDFLISKEKFSKNLRYLKSRQIKRDLCSFTVLGFASDKETIVLSDFNQLYLKKLSEYQKHVKSNL